MDPLLIVVALLIGLAGAYYVYAQQQQQKAEQERIAKAKEQAELERLQQQKKPKPKKVDITAELKKKHGTLGDSTHDHISTDHPMLLHVLKGHKFGITSAAYSPNGRFIATASTDRTIRIYLRESLNDPKARPHVITLEYDHVTALSFSSDGKILIVATVNGLIKLYHKLRNKPELIREFQADHKTNIHSVLMNDIGHWATIVTCASESDTDVKFWSTNGKLHQVVNTNQVTNYHLVASKDNRYIAVAAYTPEVKIFEITREKNGAFKKANKIMSLQGHRTGVVDLAFNGSDALPVNRMVTTCKDASFRLWDINVRYALQEDPKVVKTFTTTDKQPIQSLDMAPNTKLLVASREHMLRFMATADGADVYVIDNAFEEPIKRITFSPLGDEVLVMGKNAKHIKIYKTPSA